MNIFSDKCRRTPSVAGVATGPASGRAAAAAAPVETRSVAAAPLAAVLAASLLGACATSGPQVSRLPDAQVPALAEPAALQLAQVPPPVPPEDVLSLSEPMRDFVSSMVSGRTSRMVALDMLSQAIMNPGSLALTYDASATYTASETFFRQRGNCLSLSLMVAALARELGLKARFQEVHGEPEWDTATGLLYSAGHINVTGKVNSRRFVLDFYPDRDVSSNRGTPMSDAEAIASYYNNIGAQHLGREELAGAYLYFRQAIRIAPSLASAWSNLGVVFRRNGQLAEAEQVLLTALDYDGGLNSARNNLAVVYEAQGRIEESEALMVRIRRSRERNPFFHLAQADGAIARSDPADALARLHKALEIAPDKPLFFRHAARIAARLEQAELAADLATRAAPAATRPF